MMIWYIALDKMSKKGNMSQEKSTMLVYTCQGSEAKSSNVSMFHRSFNNMDLWRFKVQPGLYPFYFIFTQPNKTKYLFFLFFWHPI